MIIFLAVIVLLVLGLVLNWFLYKRLYTNRAAPKDSQKAPRRRFTEQLHEIIFLQQRDE